MVFRCWSRGCPHRDRFQWDQRKRTKAVNPFEEFSGEMCLHFSGLSSGATAQSSSGSSSAAGIDEAPRRRILILASHVIQYSSPLFRRMAHDPRLDLQIAYCTLQGATPSVDPEFGVEVVWDTSVLDGYPWEI